MKTTVDNVDNTAESRVVVVTATDPDGEEVTIFVDIRVTGVNEAPMFTGIPSGIPSRELNVVEGTTELDTGADPEPNMRYDAHAVRRVRPGKTITSFGLWKDPTGN